MENSNPAERSFTYNINHNSPLGANPKIPNPLYQAVGALSKLYVLNRSRFVMSLNGVMFVPSYVYNHDKIPCRLTNNILVEHLCRHYAIAVYANKYTSKFICFDVDLPDPDIVHRLVDALAEMGFPRDKIYVSTSGGKGYHVEMFFTDTMYINNLYVLYNTICEQQGFDTHKVEFRPTEKMSIKIPLSAHYKTGNVCWYLDRDTLEPINNIEYVTTIEQIDRDWATALIRKKCQRHFTIAPKSPTSRRENSQAPHVPMDEFPTMKLPGTRHRLMMSIGVELRYREVAAEDIVDTLMDWIDQQDPDLFKSSREEILRDAQDIAKFVWSPGFAKVKRDIVFDEYDIKGLLSVAGRVQRRVLFVVMVFYKRYGKAILSAERIGRFVGASEQGARNAVASLEDKKILSHQRSKKFYKDGHYVVPANTYAYHLVGTGIAQQHIPLDWDFKEESFSEAYLGLLRRAVPADEWDIYFTKQELEELRNGN